MLEVLEDKKDGCIACFKLIDGEKVAHARITNEFLLENISCTEYLELMLRTLINKVMLKGLSVVFAKDEWKTDLEKFGFEKQNDKFIARLENLKLPHDCKH